MTTNITQTHLEAAIIDQSVAGQLHDKLYAFVAVYASGTEWQLGVAVANESGYNPIDKLFKDQAEAKQWAAGLNAHIGRSDIEVCEIISSTMGGRRVALVSA